MECPWRRTLASVFLLLSPQLVPVLCQNVGPPGPLPPYANEYAQRGPFRVPEYFGQSYPQTLNGIPQANVGQFNQSPGLNISPVNGLPLLETPVCNVFPDANVARQQITSVLPISPLLNDPCANPGLVSQQMNLVPFSNALLSDYPPRGPFRVPEYSQTLNSVPQINIGQFHQGPDISPTNCLPPLPPVCNILPDTNIAPQQITQTPWASNQKFIPSTNFNLPPASNLPLPPRLQPNNIVPIVPNLQNQIVPLPQRSSSGSVLNVPAAGLQNQITQTIPLTSSPYPQSLVQVPITVPSTLTNELTSINFLPTPNLPTSPIQNFVPILQAPIQPVAYPQSIVPVDYMPNTPCSTNYQISALPPVTTGSIAPLYNCLNNPAPVTEEFSPVPINLHINVPSPIIPEPQITIITAYPSAPVSSVPVSTDSSDLSFGLYPPYPLPPIIIEGRRSRSRSWLPLFLIALIANDGGGGGGCCCCCPCSCGCSDVPIPYPIPIPTNNIIVGKGNRSGKKCSTGKATKAKTD